MTGTQGQAWGVRTLSSHAEASGHPQPSLPPTGGPMDGGHCPAQPSCQWARPPASPQVWRAGPASLLDPQLQPRGREAPERATPSGSGPSGLPRARPPPRRREQISAASCEPIAARMLSQVEPGSQRARPHPQQGSGRSLDGLLVAGQGRGQCFCRGGRRGHGREEGPRLRRWGAVKWGECWGVGGVGA